MSVPHLQSTTDEKQALLSPYVISVFQKGDWHLHVTRKQRTNADSNYGSPDSKLMEVSGMN